LELTLTSGVNYTYQYWVGETTPIANSPALVKQQTLIQLWFCHLMMMAVFLLQVILICRLSSRQEREVTVLQQDKRLMPGVLQQQIS
jgi:hypothetical protein